jgi:hypothetical protein
VEKKSQASANIVSMKSKMLAFILLAVVSAAAQGAKSQTNQEKQDPLFFVKSAAAIAGVVEHEIVNGSLGIYIAEENWKAGLNDGDLGPFLKVKEGKAGRSAACLFSQDKGSAVCVYFDGSSPFGVAAAKAGASGKIEAAEVSAAFKPVSKEMLGKGAEELTFTPGPVSTDDGQELPAFAIAATAKSKD